MVTTPTSASQLFDENLSGLLKQFPEKAKEVGAIYGFKITGEGGGEWTVDLKNDPPQVQKGLQPGAQCTIEVAHQDFLSMLGNQAVGMQLFFQGKLKVTGDNMLALKLQKLFALGQ